MNTSTALVNSSLVNRPLQPKSLLTMIAEPDLFSIGQAIRAGEVTPRGIMVRTNIPQTTLYRKITWLLDNGIIKGIVKYQDNTYRVKVYSVIEDFSGELSAKGQNLKIKLWGKEKPIVVATMSRIRQ